MKIQEQHLDRMKKELQQRFEALEFSLKGRELKNGREGCRGHYSWQHPDLLCAIETNDVNLALEDFKTVLVLLKKLK